MNYISHSGLKIFGASEEYPPEDEDTAPLVCPIPKRSYSPFFELNQYGCANQQAQLQMQMQASRAISPADGQLLLPERPSTGSADFSEPEASSSESDDEMVPCFAKLMDVDLDLDLSIDLSEPPQIVEETAQEKHEEKQAEKKSRKTLVLDLDETLVRCVTRKASSTDPEPPFDAKTQVVANGSSYELFVSFRPHLYHFLSQLSAIYTLAVFTAGTQQYADALISLIDPENKFFDGARFYRGSCSKSGAKDLRFVTDDLSSVVLLDNTPDAFRKQRRNGVLISSYLGPQGNQNHDNALLAMLPVLAVVAGATDVRRAIRRCGCGVAATGSV